MMNFNGGYPEGRLSRTSAIQKGRKWNFINKATDRCRSGSPLFWTTAILDNRLLKTLGVLILLSVLSPKSRVLASFEEYPTGGRATGVSGAMTAASDDVYGLYYNPAALMRVDRPEIGAYYGSLYGNLSDNSSINRSFLGYVHPLKTQAVGISYVHLGLDSLYKEDMVGLSYSRQITSPFSLGATLKYYRKSIGSNFDTANASDNTGTTQLGTPDPVLKNGQSAQAVGGDFGALYRLDRGWHLGALLENFNESNVAIGSGATDRVPRAWKFGAARQWGDGWQAMGDLWYGRFTSYEARLNGGVEKWLTNGMGFRAGGGYGERQYRQLTAGFSYRWNGLEFDYGFMMPLGTINGTVGTHHLSLEYRFGPVQENRHNLSKPVDKKATRAAEVTAEPTAPPARPAEAPPSVTLAQLPPAAAITPLSLSPGSVVLASSQTQRFDATNGSAGAKPDVMWSLNPALGSISGEGLYLAPGEIYFPQDVVVTATPRNGSGQSASSIIHLQAKPNAPRTLSLEVRVLFEINKAEVQSKYHDTIKKVADILNLYTGAQAVLEGYTDDLGNPKHNIVLSQERAEAVRQYLIDEFGIPAARLAAKGYGPIRPMDEPISTTFKGRRRVIARIQAAPTSNPAR